MVEAEEDIEVEVDTEEVTKEIIKEHQINKVEIMVQNSKEKGIMKIKDNLNRTMGINGIQVKWSVMSVLEQVTTQEVLLTEEEAVTQTIKGLVAGVDTRPRIQYMAQTKEKKQKKFMQGSKFKHQRHFSCSNGKSGNKVGEQSVVGSPNTKTDGQAVPSPLTTPDSSNELRANHTDDSMNNGKEDTEIKDTKRKTIIKFIIKPSKDRVTTLHKIQQMTINVAKVLSQQLKGKIESVNHKIINLIGPANETEVIISGRKVNALLDTGSQITSISESYYKNHLSNYPLVPVDLPNLKVEQADG